MTTLCKHDYTVQAADADFNSHAHAVHSLGSDSPTHGHSSCHYFADMQHKLRMCPHHYTSTEYCMYGVKEPQSRSPNGTCGSHLTLPVSMPSAFEAAF